MPRFSANVSMLFTEVPFPDRFAAAAEAGFSGIECQFPYHHDSNEIADKLAMAGVTFAVFNAPPGDYAAGERGLAALPGRESEFQESIEVALAYADMTECTRLHVMAGCITEDQRDEAMDTYLANLETAAEMTRGAGVQLLIEPISTMPGYFLTRPEQAVEIMRVLDHKNLAIQYDLHHAQRTQGNLGEFLENYLHVIGHVQVAGVPGRHEPDQLGEINWHFIFDMLDAHGYDGWVGAEYTPRAGTVQGLGWAKDWGIGVGAKTMPAVSSGRKNS
jgi:2-dehydrotetronate isomerase